MHELNVAAGAFCRASCIRKQVQKPYLSLKLEAAGRVYCPDDGNWLRVILFDENIDLRIPHVGEIARGDIAREFAFGPAGSFDGFADQRHSNTAVFLNP